MKKAKLFKTMVSFAMSAALLLSSTVLYAQAEQVTEDGITVTAEADENGFVIKNGILTKYTERTATEVEIPEGVISIGDSTFAYCNF